MTRFATLCAALLLASPAAAQDQAPPAAAPAAQDPAPPAAAPADEDAAAPAAEAPATPSDFDLARKRVVDCEGEKFVFAWGAGARPTKVTLCSEKGATPDEVVQMLDDAATKLEQSNIAEDRRIAIVQQIRAKIDELKGATAAAPAQPGEAEAEVTAVEPPPAASPAPLLAPPPAAPRAVLPAASTAVARPRTPPVLAPAPKLEIECSTLESAALGPCDMLSRDTRLTVTAASAIAPGTRLRFLRRGETRAEVALDDMRQGQSVRLALPRAICAGVVRSQASIEVTRGGQVVDSIGPYLLRC